MFICSLRLKQYGWDKIKTGLLCKKFGWIHSLCVCLSLARPLPTRNIHSQLQHLLVCGHQHKVLESASARPDQGHLDLTAGRTSYVIDMCPFIPSHGTAHMRSFHLNWIPKTRPPNYPKLNSKPNKGIIVERLVVVFLGELCLFAFEHQSRRAKALKSRHATNAAMREYFMAGFEMLQIAPNGTQAEKPRSNPEIQNIWYHELHHVIYCL